MRDKVSFRSPLSAALAGCLLLACAHEAPPVTAPAEGAAQPPRRPDGVSLDLSAARVDAHGAAPARGVVALYPAPSRDEILAVVHAYFRAFGGGNAREFAPLVAEGARRLDAPARQDLLPALDARLRAVDYVHAPVESMVRYDDARMTTYESVTPALRQTNQMQEGDVLVDVPVEEVRVGSSRLFGPRVVFVLRRQVSAWRIAGVSEDGPWS